MSDYNKATNFAAKDSLPSGNSGKIVKGTEIDTEFNAIASSIASKADINSPVFTGSPSAPTATTGSNTTQLANTAYVKQEITNLGLGTMATQAKTAVDIQGGTIVGITDLAVADGGTGASSITANNVILGNGTSALNGNLVSPATSGNVLTADGTTWTSAPPNIVGTKAQVFTSTGTFTVPAGVTAVKVLVVGGGGGGRGTSGGNNSIGGTGGTSSFGSSVIATGGTGSSNTPGTNGTTTGAAYTYPLPSPGYLNSSTERPYLSVGQLSGYLGFGTNATTGIGFPGGQVDSGTSTVSNAGYGAACIGYVTGLTSGSSITVTVGAGGSQTTNGGYSGSNGGNGIVIVEW